MKAVIEPGKLKGTVAAPPSKSYAHRILMGAAFSCLGKEKDKEALMAEGSEVSGISSSEDMLATMDCLSALGLSVRKEGNRVLIRKEDPEDGGVKTEYHRLPQFPCRESGSTLRFFIPIALALAGGGVFTGSKRLIERGIGIYEEIFEGRGICVDKTEDSISVCGKLSAGSYRIRGSVSSQFITGMLFALSLLTEDSEIEVLPPVESRSYILITLDVLNQFGIPVREIRENVFYVPGGCAFRKGSYTVEGDWSNAAFLYAFKAVGADLEIEGLNENSVQGDRLCVSFLERLSGERTETKVIDLSDTPDLGPVLFAAAASLGGGMFTGTRRLRIKESDRAAAMAEELRKFGISCIVGENEVEVLKGTIKRPSVPLNGHNDHRIVMALSVLSSLTGGEIDGAEAVRKSWPEFFEVMKSLGMELKYESGV